MNEERRGNPMAETLLSSSAILLYGRVMTDLTLDQTAYTGITGTGTLNYLHSQLNVAGAKLARIYAVSYAGEFYAFAAPTIFLVHGDGDPANPVPGPAFRAPSDADDTGVGAQNYDFSSDMQVWTYDKNDLSVRLDLSSGTLKDILLEAEFGDDMDFPSFGGGKVGGGKVGGGKVGGG